MSTTGTQTPGFVQDVRFGASGIADVTAPTVAEITALTAIECGIVGDEPPETPRSGNSVDISALCNRESSMMASTIENGNITATMFRFADGTDEYWTLFDDSVRDTQHLAIARFGFTGAAGVPAAGDVVDVYAVQILARQPLPTPRDGVQQFDAELAVVSASLSVALVA